MLPFNQGNLTVPPATQWYGMITGIVQTAINVVETLNRAKLVFEANDLAQAIEAAQTGHAVGGSVMTKEQAAALHQLIETFQVYLNTPMGEGQLKPIQVLYRTWPSPLPEEPTP